MRGWPTLVCAGFTVLACGGRTASDFGDYGSAGSGDGSNGGTGNTGNSSSGGSAASSGKGGTGATGATTGTGGSGGSINDGGAGGIGTGGIGAGGIGTGGVGAAGSGGGIAGAGGVAGTGAIMETCTSLCKDFTTVCPGQPDAQNCSGQCTGAVVTSSPQCQASTVTALTCLDKAILGLAGLGLSCDQALTFATFNCGAAFLEAQNCSGTSNPGCSGQQMASDSSCTTALDCGSTFYSVSCQSLPDGTSACSCSQSMGSTGQGSAVRVGGFGAPACGQAWQLCGFPSDTPRPPL